MDSFNKVFESEIGKGNIEEVFQTVSIYEFIFLKKIYMKLKILRFQDGKYGYRTNYINRHYKSSINFCFENECEALIGAKKELFSAVIVDTSEKAWIVNENF